MKRPLLFFTLLFVFAISNFSKAATKTWTGASNTLWNNAANWTGGVPVAGDVAIIQPTTNQPTVNVASTVGDLFINLSTTITLSANLTVTGNLTNGYNIPLTLATGSGKTLAIGGYINLTGSSSTVFTVNANNIVTCAGMTSGSSASFSNAGTITSTNGISVGGSNSLSNTGTITMSGGTMSVNNAGVINNSGNMTINGSLTSSGMTVNNSGNFFFTSGTYTANNSDVFTNAGNCTFSGGTLAELASGGKFVNVGNFFAGTSGSTTTLNIGNFNAKLTNSGNFYVGPGSAITFYSSVPHAISSLNTNTGVIANSGTFTLQSDATGSAAFGPTGSSTGGAITGTYNVQRFLTGGSVNQRSYRLLSSPVNISSSTNGTGNISLAYVNTTKVIGGVTYYGALTAGPGGSTNGFTVSNGNPTLYLYNETLASNNNSFTSGKNIGVVVVGTNTVSTLSIGVTTANVSIPVGNGFMFYFIGDNHLTTTANTRVPENTTLTASGTINQYNVPVKLWRNSSTSLDATNNFVGNPYPSTIDLDKVYSGNTIGPIFYELYDANPGQFYISYNASLHVASNTTYGSQYIASGQGFFVTATAGQTITFKENQKAEAQQLLGSKLLLSTPNAHKVGVNGLTIPSSPVIANASFASQTDNGISGLHMAMVQDSSTIDECGIFFVNNGIDKYDINDAKDLDGISPRIYMSSYTADGIRTGINALGSYTKGKRVKLFVKATTDGIYKLNLTDIKNIDVTNYNLYLKDNYTKDSLDLSHNSTYSFKIQNSDTTSFGANRFELVITPKPLPPYALTSFTAKKVNEGVLLTWNTANEGNFTGFSVEKQDGSKFTALNNLQSNGAGNYSYVDHNPTTGTNAYRLMQNGLESNISYSETVNVLYNANSLNIYPNPAKDNINIFVNVQTTDNAPTYQMSIYDPSGTLVLTRQINRYDSQGVSNLRIGTYIVRVTDNNGKLIGNTKFSKIQ